MNDEPFPSDGAPRDLQTGGTTRIWDKIDAIEKKCNKTAEDVAYIRGKYEAEEKRANRSFDLKQGLTVAGVSGAISLFIAFISS